MVKEFTEQVTIFNDKEGLVYVGQYDTGREGNKLLYVTREAVINKDATIQKRVNDIIDEVSEWLKIR